MAVCIDSDVYDDKILSLDEVELQNLKCAKPLSEYTQYETVIEVDGCNIIRYSVDDIFTTKNSNGNITKIITQLQLCDREDGWLIKFQTDKTARHRGTGYYSTTPNLSKEEIW